MQDANRSSTQPGEAATGDRSTATRGHGNVRSSSATPFTAPTHASIARPGRPPVPVRGVPVCCLLEQTRSRNGTRARICCRRRPTHAAASVVRHAPCKCVTVRSKLQLQATMRSCRVNARPELMPRIQLPCTFPFRAVVRRLIRLPLHGADAATAVFGL